MKTQTLCLILSIIVLITAGLSCKKKPPVLKMATTTSTDNTGLLDYLKPRITKDTGIDLHWVAVGSGKALELGKNCDVNILLVHAPQAEKKFIQNRYGIIRKEIMYNDFLIIGPPHDPAKIKGKAITEVLSEISKKNFKFISRGDNSGTHKKELSLWRKAGITLPDREKWYIQTGQGMLITMNIAAEHNAYTLTDRGTFIKYSFNKKWNPPLVILAESDSSLLNQYSIIIINPERCKNSNQALSRRILDWFTARSTQQLIGEFKINGKKLFIPNANTK